MKVQYVNTILDSIKGVFFTMLDLTVKFEDPVTKSICHPSHDICSVVTFNGVLSGQFVMSYPEKMAVFLASAFLEEKLFDINEDTTDAIAEIANMVMGLVDTEMELEDFSCSLPKVTMDRRKIYYGDDTLTFSVPCRLDMGSFEVDIVLSQG